MDVDDLSQFRKKSNPKNGQNTLNNGKLSSGRSFSPFFLGFDRQKSVNPPRDACFWGDLPGGLGSRSRKRRMLEYWDCLPTNVVDKLCENDYKCSLGIGVPCLGGAKDGSPTKCAFVKYHSEMGCEE